jgi:hypothetical protein
MSTNDIEAAILLPGIDVACSANRQTIDGRKILLRLLVDYSNKRVANAIVSLLFSVA